MTKDLEKTINYSNKGMTEKRLRIKKVSISIFIILFLAFHCTAYSVLKLNDLVVGLLQVTSLFICFCMYIRNAKHTSGIMAIWLLILLASFINNGFIENRMYSKILVWVICICMAYLLQYSIEWHIYLKKWLIFFSIEHFVISWFFFFFGDFYRRNVIPLFSYDIRARLLKYSNNHVLNGLTNHYSTSGMYFAIATLVFFVMWLQNKKRSSFVGLALMVISLIMTQKRGSFLFAVMAMVLTYFVYKKVKAKTFVKFFAGIAVAICGVVFLSNFIPDLKNLFNRFMELDSGDVTSGRMRLYRLAISLFLKHPIIGNGWGQYRTYSSIAAHNIYLQLLAEVGIIGTIIVCALFIASLLLTVRLIREHDMKGDKQSIQMFALLFSVAMQFFFLLYGITGNPLYDQQCLVPYFFAIAVPCSIKLCKRRKER